MPAVVQRRILLEMSAAEWPLAHPLFVALDLAQDEGRVAKSSTHGRPMIAGPCLVTASRCPRRDGVGRPGRHRSAG